MGVDAGACSAAPSPVTGASGARRSHKRASPPSPLKPLLHVSTRTPSAAHARSSGKYTYPSSSKAGAGTAARTSHTRTFKSSAPCTITSAPEALQDPAGSHSAQVTRLRGADISAVRAPDCTSCTATVPSREPDSASCPPAAKPTAVADSVWLWRDGALSTPARCTCPSRVPYMTTPASVEATEQMGLEATASWAGGESLLWLCHCMTTPSSPPDTTASSPQ